MPLAKISKGVTKINTILKMTIQSETKETWRAPVIDKLYKLLTLKRLMCCSQASTGMVQEKMGLTSSNRKLGYIQGDIFRVKGVKYWNEYKEKLPFLLYEGFTNSIASHFSGMT